MATVQHRPRSSLPATTLPWLDLRDHFVATVGPAAGTGNPLGPLVVLADATFAPRSRFPLHPHREMEILSIVLDGDLSHHGDGAHGTVVHARGAQLISSRSGMVHAEGNDTDRATRMLQLWFQPNVQGGAPAYHSRQLPQDPCVHLVAGDAGMPLRCDARVWWLDVRGEHPQPLAPGRTGYALALSGALEVDGVRLATGDGATVRGGTSVLRGDGTALWIDLAG
jgi:redox-sensitive bicupin YhaK (pirin superfamily)